MTAPKDMSEAELRQELREAIIERRAALTTAVDASTAAAIDAALAPVLDALAHLQSVAVQYGQAVAMKADAGQFLSAEGGGPAKEKEAFNLQSRATAGAWESWLLSKGSQ